MIIWEGYITDLPEISQWNFTADLCGRFFHHTTQTRVKNKMITFVDGIFTTHDKVDIIGYCQWKDWMVNSENIIHYPSAELFVVMFIGHILEEVGMRDIQWWQHIVIPPHGIHIF